MRILKGASNTIVVTLKEKQTLASPNFLFRFTNMATLEQNTCIASDSSQYTDRYNRFTITESLTENRLNGILELSAKGVWRYEVYEQSGTSLVVSTQNKLEEGRCDVYDNTSNTNFIENTIADTYVE